MKYFFLSDTHGVHPAKVLTALIDAGFQNENQSHNVVVAGDITDGLECDGRLIDFFMQLDKQNQLIAVKGNHDYWTCNGKNGVRHLLNTDQAKWLKFLPYQIETQHFLLAHGIWIDKDLFHNSNFLSSWGSPCLIGEPDSEWWGWNQHDVKKFTDIFPSLDKYEQHLRKPLFLGHFWASVVKKYLGEKDNRGDLSLDIQVDDQGLVSYGKINWVDGNIIYSKDKKVKIKVVEFL